MKRPPQISRMDHAALEIGPDADGEVVVTLGERVLRTGPRRPDQVPVAERLPCPRGRIVPGEVNAHTHLYSGLAPLGMPAAEPAPENFLQILERLWWKLDRALGEETLRASAQYAAAQALLAGTTAVVDHHESPQFIEGSLDVIADVCQDFGLRALVCYGATERNFGREEARRGLRECRRFVDANRRDLVRGAVGLHASFTVSDETIREAGHLARDLGTVVHVHVAEDRADVEDARKRGHDGPLERLLALDGLPEGSILAHGVHLTADQVRRARDAGLWLVQNPRSNIGNRVGYPAALGESPRVALGTDGYPADMREEAAAGEAEAATHGESAGAVAARLAAGRELLGERFEGPFAPLAPRGAADLAVIRENDGPEDEVTHSDSAVGPEGRSRVEHVMVGGRLVVHEGRLVHRELAAVMDDALAVAPALWERMRRL